MNGDNSFIPLDHSHSPSILNLLTIRLTKQPAQYHQNVKTYKERIIHEKKKQTRYSIGTTC